MVSPSSHDLVDPVILIRRWALVIIAAALAGGVLSVALAGQGPAVYETSVVVLVGPVVPDSDVLEGTTDLARTYGEIVESTGVIRRATEGSGVRAGQVSVSASAGRDSATLRVRIRTPSREATRTIAVNLVTILRELVADNRADVTNPAFGTLDDIALGEQVPEAGDPDESTVAFPIGSAITVIDDGVESVTDNSLGVAQSAALGALVAALLASSVALTVETRRTDDPISRLIVERFGTDLGRLGRLPILRLSSIRRSRRVVPLPRSRPRDLRYTAEALVAGERSGPSTVVLLAAPSSHPVYLRAAIQLCGGFSTPPVVIDPMGVLRDFFAPPVFRRLKSERFSVAVDDRAVVELVVPDGGRAPVDTASARSAVETLCAGVPLVFVFVPVDSVISAWLWWASVADRSVALVRPRDLGASAASAFRSRIELTDVPIDGAIALRRRLLTGRVGTVSVVEIRQSYDPVGSVDFVNQLTGTQ